jgi:hypothetical protein
MDEKKAAADLVRETVAAFNAASEAAFALGLRVDANVREMRALMGEFPCVAVSVFEAV